VDRREKKALLRAWRAEQRAEARAAFPTSAERLRSMFDMLSRELPVHGCDHTRRMIEAWVAPEERDAIFRWLDTHGGFCDCTVLANVEQHVDDALHGLSQPLPE